MNTIKKIDSSPESIEKLLQDIQNHASLTAHPQEKCQCARCAMGETAYRQHLITCLKTIGWYTTYVPSDCDSPTHFSARTFGLAQNFNHPDLQIVVPMDDKLTHMIFTNAIRQIKEGMKFIPDDKTEYENIIWNGYKIKFIIGKDGKSSLYRIILPNKDHSYQGGVYSIQYL